MKAEQFIRELQRARPSEEDLASHGLDEDEIAAIVCSFSAARRENPQPIAVEAGEVGRLVALYDCSTIQIGLIQLEESIVETKYGFLFGACEADPLFVSHDRSVVMHDHLAPDSAPTRCAADTAQFLDALAEFLRIQLHKSEWKQGVDAAVEKCRTASGELESGPFYRSLLAFLQGA